MGYDAQRSWCRQTLLEEGQWQGIMLQPSRNDNLAISPLYTSFRMSLYLLFFSARSEHETFSVSLLFSVGLLGAEIPIHDTNVLDELFS